MKNNFNRTSSHASAMFMNLAKSLILHKRIFTTSAKAKFLRPYVEKILTKAKDSSTHSRRIVFSYFQDKKVIKELFNEVAPKISQRPGGYVRIIKTSERSGDKALMSMVELTDYNSDYNRNTSLVKNKKTRRSKKSGSAKAIEEEKVDSTY